MPKVPTIKLQHEMMVLDADLVSALDETKMLAITKSLISKLLKSLKMKPLGNLEVYEAMDKRAPGWSFIQPITTSHISGHYFEKPGPKPHIHIDIYSCKKLNWRSALKVIHKNLHLDKWSVHFIKRNADIKKSTIHKLSGVGAL